MGFVNVGLHQPRLQGLLQPEAGSTLAGTRAAAEPDHLCAATGASALYCRLSLMAPLRD